MSHNITVGACLRQNVFKLLEAGFISNEFMWAVGSMCRYNLFLQNSAYMWLFLPEIASFGKAMALIRRSAVRHPSFSGGSLLKLRYLYFAQELSWYTAKVNLCIDSSDLFHFGWGKHYQRKVSSILFSLMWVWACLVLLDYAARLHFLFPKWKQRVTHHHSLYL